MVVRQKGPPVKVDDVAPLRNQKKHMLLTAWCLAIPGGVSNDDPNSTSHESQTARNRTHIGKDHSHRHTKFAHPQRHRWLRRSDNRPYHATTAAEPTAPHRRLPAQRLPWEVLGGISLQPTSKNERHGTITYLQQSPFTRRFNSPAHLM